MSPVDAAWFRMDPAHPADIISVMALDGAVDEAELRAMLEQRLVPRPRFRRRIVESPGAMTPPRWEDEPGFSLDAHLRRVSLAAPGGEAEFLALLNQLANDPLEFGRSPWRIWLVDGSPAGSILVIHLHHCMGDGFALLGVLLSLTDLAPGGPPAAARFASPLEHEPARHRLGRALATARRIERGLLDFGHLVSLPFDPATRLRGKPLGERRLAWSTGIEVSRVKALARERAATINDVLMAALAGALRQYLLDHGDEPRGLRAIVPVNLRPAGEPLDEEHGNWFGLVWADLPVAEPDREARLADVVATMARIKSSEEAAVSLAVMGALGRSPGVVERVADELFARKGTLVVTNVPGPRQPLYLVGHRIRDMMFWAPHPSGLACGASILSYAGTVRVGIRSDAAVVQDPELLARHFDDEFVAWERESSERKAAPPRGE